jgi:hypothetical protein
MRIVDFGAFAGGKHQDIGGMANLLEVGDELKRLLACERGYFPSIDISLLVGNNECFEVACHLCERRKQVGVCFLKRNTNLQKINPMTALMPLLDTYLECI